MSGTMNIQQMQNHLRKENLAFGKRMTLVYAQDTANPGEPFRVWRSNRFLAQLFRDEHAVRLTINRTALNHEGHWEDGITWDELQAVKSECGYGHMCGLEVYPADAHVINDANLRHLFLMVSPPPFAWEATNGGTRQTVAEVLS